MTSNTVTTPVSQMTCADLEELLTVVVRRVVREELQNAGNSVAGRKRRKKAASIEAAFDFHRVRAWAISAG